MEDEGSGERGSWKPGLREGKAEGPSCSLLTVLLLHCSHRPASQVRGDLLRCLRCSSPPPGVMGTMSVVMPASSLQRDGAVCGFSGTCILLLLPWPGEPTNPSQGQDCLLLLESSLTAHGPRVSISDLLLPRETSTALSMRLCYLCVFLHLLHNEWEVNECSLSAEPLLCSSPLLASYQ